MSDMEGSDDDLDEEFDLIPKKRCRDIRGCGDLYIYLKQNPRTFLAASLFITSITAVLVLGITYSTGFHPNTSYAMAGVAGIVSNLYGFCHFRTLLSLKKEVDVYSTNNKNFAQENHLLNSEVNRFSQARSELGDTEKRIKQAIKRQQVNLNKFRELNKNLEATGKQNMELLGKLNSMASKMQNKWKDELIKKERKILHVCFDRFKWEDENDGISREQFTEFKMTLPLEYQLRITRAGDWKEIAGDDGILQLDEFTDLLDAFAEDVADQKHQKRMSNAPEQTAEILKVRSETQNGEKK